MSLDLNSAVESQIVDRARAAGISANDYVARLLQSDGHRDPIAHVDGLLAAWQREYGLAVPPGGYRTTAELFSLWDAEDSRMTDDEREKERLFWADFERNRSPVRI